jgi:NADH-quinone oxidoreductase subunit H
VPRDASEFPLEGVPNLALRKERVPNLDGARLAGYSAEWKDALAKVEGASLVLLLDPPLDDAEAERLARAATVVALTTLDDERLKGASLLLPVSSMVEEHGTYLNRDRRVQRYTQAKAAPGMARPAWWVAAEAWALGAGDRSAPGTAAEAFARLGETIPALAGLRYSELGPDRSGAGSRARAGRCGAMSPEYKGFLLLSILKMLVVFTVVMIGVALLTLMERKVSAWMQNRRGPNRVGWAGLLQPAADGLKNIIKEETFPASANPLIFTLAPVMAFIPALLLSAVIPWAAPLPVNWDAHLPLIGQVSYHGMLSMAVTDLPVGFLFVLAVSSLGVYGIALAGWSSNNKYSLLGGLRSSAQMISYEVAMGMSLIPILLVTGNVSFAEIVTVQQQGLWFVLPLFLSCFIFLVAGFAETNRLPFDLPEAESELIAGYHTEYSAMKFSMFPISEYANMATVSAMVVTLFFGGWDIPFWSPAPGVLRTLLTAGFMFAKVMFFLFFFMWIRWTLPRFRYDQLMALGWKVMLPLAVLYIMLISLALWVIEHWAGVESVRMRMGILFGLNLVVGYLVFYVLDRGLIVSGSYRARAAQLPIRPSAPPENV